MSRYHPHRSLEPMLNAAQHWKEVALLSDGAVFAQEPVWTLPYLRDLKKYIIDNPLEGEGGFITKMEKQLVPSKPEVKKLIAEMLWVWYLCPDDSPRTSTKQQRIRQVWELSEDPFPNDSRLMEADVLAGAGSIGQGLSQIWNDLGFFIHMMIAFKELDEPKRVALLSDGWKFGEWLGDIEKTYRRPVRTMIMFLLFPDDFEHIWARTHRTQIVQKFTGKPWAETNKMSALEIDRALLDIRREQEKEHDTKELDFYESPLKELWQDSEPNNSHEPDPADQPPEVDTMQYPLNQILYGPPGTGKTWNTVYHALAIIEGKSVRDLESEGHESAKGRFDELKESGQIAMVTFHQNFAYEDFIEGIRPVLDDKSESVAYELSKGVFKQMADRARADEDADQNYVLIIDEINRGNIAKIFGELITLIEPSKRLGEDDQATVTLSYSQDEFGVPDNLYLIGTMNTADRSIALLDTALRRRFEFVEMMPNPSHELISTDIDGVNCQELLKAMNDRIRFLFDREHQIGHTYFFEVESMDDLEKAFKTKIIPLLQEYFFDNWEKINLVLNENGFIQKVSPENGLLESDLIDRDRNVYELLPENNSRWKAPQSYRAIYEKDGQDESTETEQDA